MTLKELTDAAGIERVIWIDDLFDAPAENGAEIQFRELAARAKARDMTLNLAGRDLTPEETVEEWLARIEETRQEGMTAAVILADLRQSLGDGEAAPSPDYDESAIAEIMGSFGEGMVTKAGASQWRAIIPSLRDAKQTLVVVDREFFVEGVSSPLGENILQDVVKAKGPTVHVVMLTRSVDEDPEALRNELANRLGIPFQDFVVAAKVASEEKGQAESRLCDSFQVVFTHHVCIELARRIQRVATTTLDTTVDALSRQSVYDLDRVVFGNSLIEGASELDVLTRLLLLRQRVAVDRELGCSNDYFDLLSRLRALRARAGALTPTQGSDPKMLTDWRRDEVVDPNERVNRAHAPLACGDVFVRSGSSEVFVLLGQPCDMAVRPDGSRNTHEAIFARAEQWNPEQPRQERNGFIGSTHHFFTIPALPIAGNGRWRLDLRRWASVNLRLLDFSVFSGTGAVELDLSAQPPVFLLPGWRKMLDRAKRKITAQEELPAEYAALSLSKDVKQRATSKNGDVIALSYTRVGRLRRPWAVAAYAAFTGYQARAAFDHDFAS